MNAFNRLLLIVLGASLLAVGAAGVAHGFDLTDATAVEELRSDLFSVDWTAQTVRIIVLASGLVGALLSLAMVIREVLPRRRPEVMLEVAVSDKGRTRVSKSALRRSYERATEGTEGVSRARVRALSLSERGVGVELEAEVAAGYSVADIGSEILARGTQAVHQTFPDRPGRVDAVVELAHGRRARKRTRRVQ